jgi:hypothetical protein
MHTTSSVDSARHAQKLGPPRGPPRCSRLHLASSFMRRVSHTPRQPPWRRAAGWCQEQALPPAHGQTCSQSPSAWAAAPLRQQPDVALTGLMWQVALAQKRLQVSFSAASWQGMRELVNTRCKCRAGAC